MKLHLEWMLPVQLKEAGLTYAVDLEKFPVTHGVYIFGRKYGKDFEALYIGKSSNIRGRVKSHLNSVRLMSHLSQAKKGKRVVLAGKFITQSGQQLDKCLRIIERALIRHFLSEGHDLVNKHGTRLRRHEIASDGKHPKKFVPKLMFIDKARGE